MKRNMDLVRNILIAIEDHDTGFAPESIQIPGHTDGEVGFHLVLMNEAGLIKATDVTEFGGSSPSAVAERLTWEGYEFLDAARNATVWARVQRIVAEKGGSISFEVLKFVVMQTAKEFFLPGGDGPPLPPPPNP